jgi:bifunctional non-homologous end joining protein LigD
MLEEYKRKRDFQSTPEPSGEQALTAPGEHRFVVQKHAASHLHYDFRLEAGGVLKSWAVPKGPSMNPQDKHLAVMVEDHPLGYADFEGVIPEGEYGGGQVIVWDNGTYELIAKDAESFDKAFQESLDRGKLHISLHGSKLKGEFVLLHMHDKPKDWLLIKVQDSFASTEQILEQDRSVLSGRTIDDVRNGQSKP